VPAGTLVTVQLERSLVPSKVRAGDPFTASVAGPLIIDGDTLVERGTSVSGRVESAQTPENRAGRGLGPGSSLGYIRLSLTAITVEGRQLALQTSSLFAKGAVQPIGLASGERSDPGGVILKGRPLTFRLTAPLTLGETSSVADRQDPEPAR
jgi:hypothetical protein